MTHVFDDLATRFRLPREEAITWKGEDGVTVEGLLYYPLDYRRGSATRSSCRRTVARRPATSSEGCDDFLRDMVGHYYREAHLDLGEGAGCRGAGEDRVGGGTIGSGTG